MYYDCDYDYDCDCMDMTPALILLDQTTPGIGNGTNEEVSIVEEYLNCAGAAPTAAATAVAVPIAVVMGNENKPELCQVVQYSPR